MLKINAEHDPCYKNIVKPCTNFLPLFIVKLGRGGEDRALKIAVKLDLYRLCMIFTCTGKHAAIFLSMLRI